MIKLIITIYFFCLATLKLHAMCRPLEDGVVELSQPHPVAERHAPDIYMHTLAKEFNINPYVMGAATSSAGYEFRGYSNSGYLFTRDYFPLQIKSIRNGQLKSIFIKYPSLIHGGKTFSFTSPHSRHDRPSPNHEYLRFEAERTRIDFWAETKTLPLILEGGNILQSSTQLFIGRKVLDINSMNESNLIRTLTEGNESSIAAAKQVLENARESGWRTRSEQEILELIAQTFELKVDQIQVLDPMPYEATTHIDMYMSLIGPNSIAMPYIPNRFLTAEKIARTETLEVSNWLNNQAELLVNQGFEVVRVPMTPIESTYQKQQMSLATVRSPVNWIIRGTRIQVPEYPDAAKRISASAREEIKNEITEALRKHGFTVEFINAEKLINTKGSLHCITTNYDLSEYYHLQTEAGLL